MQISDNGTIVERYLIRTLNKMYWVVPESITDKAGSVEINGEEREHTR